MKPCTALALSLGTLLTLSSCYVYRPPAPLPHRNGASLDTPPETRYMNGPTDPLQAGPQEPGSIGGIPIEGQPQPPAPGPITTTEAQPPVVPGNVPPAVNTPPTPLPQPPKPPAQSGLPFGIKVPSKPGFVYSPYDKTAGIVDVQGYATGTKVKCPYTGKTFLVP